MTGPVLVINPNSLQAVTDGIDRAMEPLRRPGGPEIRCLTLDEGPPGIQSQRDADAVVGPLCRLVAAEEATAAAFVIACFGDPGLQSVRETTSRPVLGICESGLLTAMTLGQRIGVIAILPNSVPRHLRLFAAMGISDRIVGDRPVGLGVAELGDEDRTLARMAEVGRILRDTDGADVLVMGCAGMARFRDPLERTLGIPVVEPTQAAVSMAIGRTWLGWSHRRWAIRS